jgi:hypothetical protein
MKRGATELPVALLKPIIDVPTYIIGKLRATFKRLRRFMTQINIGQIKPVNIETGTLVPVYDQNIDLV